MASTRHSSLPVSRLVAVQGHRAEADQHRLALDVGDHGRGKGLAEVAFARCGLPVAGSRSWKSTLRSVFQTVLPGLLVQGDDVLAIAAVEVQDEQVLVDERRRAGPAEVIADEVGALPDHLARLGVEAAVVRGAEAHVDASLLDHRRRRRIGVERDGSTGAPPPFAAAS